MYVWVWGVCVGGSVPAGYNLCCKLCFRHYIVLGPENSPYEGKRDKQGNDSELK